MKRVVLLAAVLSALVGCGGGTETVFVTESRPTSSSGTPNISPALTQQWPSRWCEVQIGDSREEVTRIMGSSPTKPDSHKFPLVPQAHLNPRGELVDPTPPMPAGSDTWETPGTYQFNAFYDTSLRVQQLDFGGPDGELKCASIRVG